GTDGSPAVRLGDGDPSAFSPDGKWVLALTMSATPEIMLLPTGAGSPRKVAVDGIKPLGAGFLGDGRNIAVFHSAPEEQRPMLSIVGIDGGRPRPVPVNGLNVDGGVAFSPDGTRVAYVGAERRIVIAPLGAGTLTNVPGA